MSADATKHCGRINTHTNITLSVPHPVFMEKYEIPSVLQNSIAQNELNENAFGTRLDLSPNAIGTQRVSNAFQTRSKRDCSLGLSSFANFRLQPMAKHSQLVA